MTDRDRAAWLLFDWLTVPAGLETDPTYEMFGKFSGPPWEANIFNSQLAPPMGFIAQSLHCFYGQMEENDRQRLREQYVVEFTIGCKVYYEAPLITIPDYGVWLPFRLEMGPDQPLPPGNFGAIPQYIPWGVGVSIRLHGDPFRTKRNGYGLRFLPVLNGYLDRSVQ